jgi:outer membrane biosynthesis protein TonB
MAAEYPRTDVLSRVRREQRTYGKPSAFAGLRIVLAATAITAAMLLLAFGTIGILLKVRTPQEPVVNLIEPAPPAVQQVETPQPMPESEPAASSIHEKKPEVEELEKRPVKTLRVIAPPAPPAEQNEAVAKEEKSSPAPDPETTATIPPPQTQPRETERPRAAPRTPRPKQASRPGPDAQNDNPLFQLFGIKKYR